MDNNANGNPSNKPCDISPLLTSFYVPPSDLTLSASVSGLTGQVGVHQSSFLGWGSPAVTNQATFPYKGLTNVCSGS